MSHFVKHVDDYAREYDIQSFANHDLAFYISRHENIPMEEALKFVERKVKPVDVDVEILRRKRNGDREAAHTTILTLLADIRENKLILAPSMTAYIPPHVKKSVIAEYIQNNMNLRKADKKNMFLYTMRKDMVKAGFYKVLQESRKIKNNSLSGMHSSTSTPWYNLSSHSSLTSTCRCATSYANAGNEKFLGGLRHYYVPNIVIYHITVAARHSNIKAIERACKTFNLHYPTAEECMEIVRWSTQYYWHHEGFEKEIYEYLQVLTPAQRAAFAYTGDFYHLDKYNPEFIQSYLKDMSKMVEGVHPDPAGFIKTLDDNFKVTASYLCAPLIKGYNLGDAEKENPEAFHAVALTAQHLQERLEYYIDFVHGFLRQEYLPLSIAYFPSSFRKSVPTSDTDSTIFTTQYWVHKYGGVPYSHEANSIQYIMTFMIAGMTEHQLKMYSANLGVAKAQLGQLEMKNEYIFPTFSLTSIKKHYFNYMSAQEGNVFEKLKVDIKGVNMRSSNAPPAVNDAAADLMKDLMNKQIAGNQLRLKDVILPVVTIENQIIEALKRGDNSVYNTVQIKDSISYTQGVEAPAYKAHLFWNKIFGPQYGYAPEPPYRAIKVAADLPNKTAIQAWLESIENIEIRERLTEWVNSEGKTEIKVFRLPRSTLEVVGIPKELHSVINIRKLTLEIMKPFYFVLEACGIFMLNEKNTRLISDEYVVNGNNVTQIR